MKRIGWWAWGIWMAAMLCSWAVWAQAAGTGTSGAVILKQTFSPRAEAMGEAQAAV